jgi:hypothetical protein
VNSPRSPFFRICLLSLLSGVGLPSTTWAQDPEIARDQSDAYDDESDDEPEPDQPNPASSPEEKGPSAGGLEAPDAMAEPEAEQSSVEKELQKSDDKDAGRGLEFVWLDAHVGYQLVNLSAFRSSNFLVEGASKALSGVGFGGAAGVRILYFSLGARFRYAPLSSYNLWTLGAEVSLRIPYGALEPYAFLGAGYAGVSRAKSADGDPVRQIGGIDVRAGGGLDYYLSHTFSLGGQLAFDALGLRRAAQGDDLCEGTSSCGYDSQGKATGFSFASTFVLGLHF